MDSSTKSDFILRDIEKHLGNFYPKHWNGKNIFFPVDKGQFNHIVPTLNLSLNEPMRDFLFRGGKRIRPRLLLLLLEAFGISPKHYFKYANFVELIHNGTLILDDIEDNSKLRRGKPACHIKYGVDIATNVGAAMHFLPLAIFLKNGGRPIPPQQRLRIYEIYSEELINIYCGQATDIYWHKYPRQNIRTNEYFEMCRLKTGSLMRMSVRLACALANKNLAEEHRFMRFAELAGVAFQIQDDVLDLTADQKEFGKSFGNDISEGKISLPIILALRELTFKDRTLLLKILHAHTFNTHILKKALQLIHKTRALEKARYFAHKFLRESLHHLKKTKIKPFHHQVLEDFVMSFVRRKM